MIGVYWSCRLRRVIVIELKEVRILCFQISTTDELMLIGQ
jgi:hypothetical protein